MHDNASDLDDGITVLRVAGINEEKIAECLSCMRGGNAFDECARRVGVTVKWEGRDGR